jgi:DNA-binding NarL/FixJ family response regulator
LPQVGASILVASDHFPVRDRLRAPLADAGFDVSTVADAGTAVRVAERKQPDLCLIDVDMPAGGVSVVVRVLEAAPGAVVVALAFSDEDDGLLLATLEAGASGCLLKDVDVSLLPDLLRRALDGEALLSRRLTARLVEELREHGRRRRIVSGQAPGTELTRREWQVLDLLARHLTTAEIAAQLFIAPVTVRTHVASIVRKLRAPNRHVALRLLEARREPSATR